MKWIRSFLMGFLMLTMAYGAWAAGTVVVASDKLSPPGLSGKPEMREVSYTVAFDASAGSPANTALDAILTSNGTSIESLGGWWIQRVDVHFGATGPTDDTGVYLYKATGASKSDLFGGNGADALDAAGNVTFYPATSTQALFGDEVISFTGNSVNSATCTIVFTLYR